MRLPNPLPSLERVIFRCDGNTATGLGHVSRCLALGEALSEIGSKCAFAGDFAAAAQSLLRGAAFPFTIVPALGTGARPAETLRDLAGTDATCLIVDSYDIGEKHLVGWSRQFASVMMIDDFARLPSYACAAVLNFTVNASQLAYSSGPRYLLGPSYLLVRRRLRHLRARGMRRAGGVRRVLVAIGGTDRHQLARRVVAALAGTASHLVIRLAAASAEMAGPLARFGPESGLIPMGADLAGEFASADVCISGGGLTKYESAYLGVPGAVLSQTPEQAAETKCFAGHGLAFDLGLGSELPPDALAERLQMFLADDRLRQSLAEAGRAIFPEDPTRNAAEALVACQSARLS